MGPIWGRQDPGRPHVGPCTNLAFEAGFNVLNLNVWHCHSNVPWKFISKSKSYFEYVRKRFNNGAFTNPVFTVGVPSLHIFCILTLLKSNITGLFTGYGRISLAHDWILPAISWATSLRWFIRWLSGNITNRYLNRSWNQHYCRKIFWKINNFNRL